MDEKQNYCFISVDEIHIKPGITYRGNHLIGHAADTETTCVAKTVLAMMVNPSLGAPPFVGRLLPIYSLHADFLHQQLLTLIGVIHNAGGYVYLVMSDHLLVNQKLPKTFHSNYESLRIFPIVP